MVSSCFVDFSIDFFARFATSYCTCLAKKVGSTRKGFDSFGFSIDYYTNLKIVEDLEAYLVSRPMVDIEQ